MSDAPRKRMPLPLNDDDRKTMDHTARMGGMKSTASVPVPSSPVVEGKGAVPTNDVVVPSDPEARSAKLTGTGQLSRNDLRPQISPTSKLAEVLGEILSGLDPTAQKFVKPVSVLGNFFAEYDDDLAKLFREKMVKR